MKPSTDAQRYTIRSVDRAVRILKAFTGSETQLSTADVAERADVPRSTAFRILATLEAGGVVERGEDGDRYRLGPGALMIGGAALRQVSLPQRVRPFLYELTDLIGETVHLVIFREHQAIVVDKIDSHHAVRLVSDVGFRSPLHATSAGKLLLAYQQAALVETILQTHEFVAYTPDTIQDPVAMRQELDRICKQGYALDDEEFEIGLRCIAAPICDYSASVVAAVSISGPIQRMTNDKVRETVPLMKDITGRISYELGYSNLTKPMLDAV